MFKIFLVENERNLNQLLISCLEQEGWVVYAFNEDESALQAIQGYPHLWIFDLRFSDDGYQILYRFKEQTPYTPILFIIDHNADFDRITNLLSANDDFLIKPIFPQELVIRTKRLLERAYPSVSTNKAAIKLHPYVLNERKREVLLGADKIRLTSKEFDLLWYFAKHQGKALSREQIINQIWGSDHVGTERLVDDLVRRLRRKLLELRIETLYCYGYRMTLQ